MPVAGRSAYDRACLNQLKYQCGEFGLPSDPRFQAFWKSCASCGELGPPDPRFRAFWKSCASCGELGPPDPRFRAFWKSCASCGEFRRFPRHHSGPSGDVWPGRCKKAIGKTPHNRHNYPKKGVIRNLAGQPPRNWNKSFGEMPVVGSLDCQASGSGLSGRIASVAERPPKKPILTRRVHKVLN